MDQSGSPSAAQHSSVCANGRAEEQLLLRIAMGNAGESDSVAPE